MSKRPAEKRQHFLMFILGAFLMPIFSCSSSDHPKKISSPASYNSQGRGLTAIATALNSIGDESEPSLMKELFDPNAPAQQNINPSTTMPLMPHTVKEIQYASGMK